MKEMLQDVLKDITPEDNPNIKKFIEIIKKKITAKGEIFIGGSYAKNTHIGNNYDCDLFIRFDKKYADKDISKILKEIIDSLKLKYEIIHGSRDYYAIDYEKVHFELIPVLKLDKPSEAKNIMDLSPLHVKWLKEKMLKHKKINEEIRLTKKLFKAAKIYGAESYIKGFSGHVLDILIINSNGMLNFLKTASKWPKTTDVKFKKIIIDPENYYKKKDVFFYMNKSKTEAPIIVIDPIIPDRNAAAAISNECYDNMIDLAKAFLKNPSKKFFEIEDITKEKLEKKYKNKKAIEITVTPLIGGTEVVGGKLLKALNYMAIRFEKQGFEIIFYDWQWDKANNCKFFFVPEAIKIPDKYLHKGPVLEMKDAVVAFKKANKGKYVTKNGIIFVEKKRIFTDAIKCANSIIKDKYVVERVKTAKIIN